MRSSRFPPIQKTSAITPVQKNVVATAVTAMVLTREFMPRMVQPNAEPSRSRRGLRHDEANEQRVSKSRRKRTGKRLSAPATGSATLHFFAHF